MFELIADINFVLGLMVLGAWLARINGSTASWMNGSRLSRSRLAGESG